MENNCLVTKLKGSVQNDNLPKIGDLKISLVWGGATSFSIGFGPGTVSNKIDDALDVKIIYGGTVNGQSSYHADKGTSISMYSSLTFAKTEGATTMEFIVNNVYTINGFLISNQIYKPDINAEVLGYMINVNRMSYPAAYLSGNISITDIVERQRNNGREKGFSIYCYANAIYDKYEGETTFDTVSKEVTVTPNTDFTEYTLSSSGTIFAKRGLVGGVWTSMPTT